jgi:hypothetical protein
LSVLEPFDKVFAAFDSENPRLPDGTMNAAQARALTGLAVCAAGVAFLARPSAVAAGWVPTAGDLGRSDSRYALHIGGNYGVISGAEVEGVDPGIGYEGGLSFRVLGSLSVFGSYAVNSSTVDAQLIEILDQDVRPERRSGHVEGDVETSRLRAGLRIDAHHESGWRFRPYLVGAVLFSTIDVKIDSVDNVSPPPKVPTNPPGSPPVDIRKISDEQLGAMLRFGVEYYVMRAVAIDLNVSHEVVEFPAGTNAITSFHGGLSIRP